MSRPIWTRLHLGWGVRGESRLTGHTHALSLTHTHTHPFHAHPVSLLSPSQVTRDLSCLISFSQNWRWELGTGGGSPARTDLLSFDFPPKRLSCKPGLQTPPSSMTPPHIPSCVTSPIRDRAELASFIWSTKPQTPPHPPNYPHPPNAPLSFSKSLEHLSSLSSLPVEGEGSKANLY